jgi:phosphoenolpyruvate---glycerone phosphotransferase subunit DhaK
MYDKALRDGDFLSGNTSRRSKSAKFPAKFSVSRYSQWPKNTPNCVALTPCTVPAAGRPNFTLADNEMEMGVGIHGEPGRRRVSLASADAIADELVGAILNDLAPKPGSEVLLLINGFGATPLIQLYLMVNSAKRILQDAGITVTRFLTGSYVTALDMAGVSVTVSLLEGQAKALWDAPVHTAALRWGA